MKFGLLVMLGLAVGALISHFLLQDNGYVLLQFMGYTVEMSVPVLAFLMILAYLGVRFLVRLWQAPAKLGEAAARAKLKRANKRITQGYIELAEGNFAKGERLLTKGIRSSETPLLNYLAAARAAQAQGDAARRDTWLNMAQEQSPDAGAAVMLTRAELQISNGELDEARKTLRAVLIQSPRSGEAMKLLADLFVAKENWQQLATLLPKLKKRRHVSTLQLDDWYLHCYAALLREPGRSQSDGKKVWKEVPRHLRSNPILITARVDAAIDDGNAALAEELIRKALNEAWDNGLVSRYGQLNTKEPQKALKQAEKWLTDSPEDPTLLLTSARLCIKAALWGKARSYIESSIAIHPTPEAYNELGQLMIKLGEEDRASVAFQQGLELAYQPAANRPRLTTGSET